MKEIRVYVVDSQHIETADIDDETFIDIAEVFGNVYCLKGFQDAFNQGLINSETDFIRIIEKEILVINKFEVLND